MKVLSRFGLGINLGYKTYNGIGPVFIWHPSPIFDFETGLGYSAYNGAKFGLGTKIYPFKKGNKVLPFIGIHYSVTTGSRIKTEVVDTRPENYRTYSNQYVIGTVGFWVKGEQIQHQFALGYCGILTYPTLVPDNEKQANNHSAEIKRGLASGISATYTIYLNLNKLDD